MNNSRVADRLGGFIIGLPTVALPIWIAGWSHWLGVVTTILFLFIAVSYVLMTRLTQCVAYMGFIFNTFTFSHHMNR